MQWKPFIYEGTSYDLSHLFPHKVIYTQPAQKSNPERKYSVEVHYSLHCFTRGIKERDNNNVSLHCRDDREVRLFDFKRYKLSFQLPDIVRSLGEKNCFHTDHGSFFTIEVVNPEGKKEDYEVYFEAKKDGKDIKLYIHSAYVRDPERIKERPKKKKIKFHIILYKTLNNQKIHKPA